MLRPTVRSVCIVAVVPDIDDEDASYVLPLVLVAPSVDADVEAVLEDDDEEDARRSVLGCGVESGDSASWRPLKLRFLRMDDMMTSGLWRRSGTQGARSGGLTVSRGRASRRNHHVPSPPPVCACLFLCVALCPVRAYVRGAGVAALSSAARSITNSNRAPSPAHEALETSSLSETHIRSAAASTLLYSSSPGASTVFQGQGHGAQRARHTHTRTYILHETVRVLMAHHTAARSRDQTKLSS